MHQLDLLLLVIAAVLILELRRAFGRRRKPPPGPGPEGEESKPLVLPRRLARRDGPGARGEQRGQGAEGREQGAGEGAGMEGEAADVGFADAVREALAGEPEVRPVHESAAPDAPGTRRKKAEPPAPRAPELAAAMEALSKHDPAFREGDFLAGAQRAYEEILEAWAVGDYAALESLLGEPARGRFFAQMRQRGGENKGRWRAPNLVAILSAKVVAARVGDARTGDAKADVDVEFLSEQFESLRGPVARRRGAQGGPRPAPAGPPVEPGPLGSVREVWRFRRKLASGDPNWMMVEVLPAA